MVRRLSVSVVVLFVIVSAACGSNSGTDGQSLSATEQELLDQFRANMDEPDDEFGDMELTLDEELCMVRQVAEDADLVRVFLADDPETEDVDQALMMMDITMSCIGEKLVDMMVQEMLADSDMSEDQGECVVDGLFADSDLWRSLAEAGMADESDVDALGMGIVMKMFEVFADCDIPLSALG